MNDRFNPQTALDELNEDALLPHPVRLRDMILRVRLGADAARDLNRDFQSYLAAFGQVQQMARGILEKLVEGEMKQP